MENLGKKYCPVTPEGKENIIKKLAPSARERVKEIYRFLPTADDLKKEEGDNMRNNHMSARTEEVYLLRKMLSPFEKRSDKEMRYTSYHAGTMTEARLRCIGVRLKTDGYTGIKAIRLYPAETMDTEARLRYIDARLKAGGYTGIRTINRT